MANDFRNTSFVSMKILRLLLNKLVIAEQFNTNWNDEFKREFAVGDTITVKKPARFTIRTGMAYTPSDLVRQTTTLHLDEVFGIDFEWDDYEKAINMERSSAELERNYFEPAAQKLYQELESRCAQFAYRNTPNVFGALGTNPTTLTPFLDAESRLFDKAAPDGERKLVISSRMMASFLVNQAVQFNPSSEITRQYKKGVVGMHGGSEWFRSQSLYRHTAGTAVTALTVAGAGQSGSTLNLNGTNGETLLRGDVISIANVNFVNPNTLRTPAGLQVQHFVVTSADMTIAGGIGTVTVYPAIVGPGSPYQNVDALAANLAAVTLWPGTATPSGKAGVQGLMLTKDAFGMAFAKFDSPKSVEMVSQTRDPETGANIRFVRDWDLQNSRYRNRFDMCVGFGVLYADECAARVVGA